jgi:hypothetical protein
MRKSVQWLLVCYVHLIDTISCLLTRKAILEFLRFQMEAIPRYGIVVKD